MCFCFHNLLVSYEWPNLHFSCYFTVFICIFDWTPTSDTVTAMEEQIDGNKMEKIITATKKGAAVLDQWLPDHIKAHYHVLQLVIQTRYVYILIFLFNSFLLTSFLCRGMIYMMPC